MQYQDQVFISRILPSDPRDLKRLTEKRSKEIFLSSSNDGGGIFREAVSILNVFKHRCLTIDQLGVGL